MANVFRNEVLLKGSDEAIAGFINKYFSVEQGCKFIDFEKLLPLEGKKLSEVWGRIAKPTISKWFEQKAEFSNSDSIPTLARQK